MSRASCRRIRDLCVTSGGSVSEQADLFRIDNRAGHIDTELATARQHASEHAVMHQSARQSIGHGQIASEMLSYPDRYNVSARQPESTLMQQLEPPQA